MVEAPTLWARHGVVNVERKNGLHGLAPTARFRCLGVAPRSAHSDYVLNADRADVFQGVDKLVEVQGGHI